MDTRLLATAAAFLGTACVPHLETPDWADGGEVGSTTAVNWEAPENRWDSLEGPPPDLEAEGYQRGDVFPDLRLRDQHGDQVAFWQWYGMVIALDLSTMWCGPCQGLAAEVDHTWKDYRDEGFIYITMMPENVTGEPPSKADLNQWADTFGISAPILSDRDGHTYDINQGAGFPQIMIIGRDMRITEPSVTPPEDGAIRTAIEAAL